jgi:hypothetical protein
MSLCKGYSLTECSVKSGCKVANGKKRSFCRKSTNIKNKKKVSSKRSTKKASSKRSTKKTPVKRKTKRVFRFTQSERLKGYNKRQALALRRLK